MRIAQLFRFPIKGLPGESIDSGTVSVGGGLLGDRGIAFTNGTVEVHDEQWGNCHSFTILKNNKSLQKWRVKSTPPQITVTAPTDNFGSSLTVDASTTDGVARLGEYLSEHLPAQGSLKRSAVTMAKGMFDSRLSGISIINPKTVERLSVAGQIDMDPRRYRGNILLDGLPAFAEFGLIGKVLRIGETRIAITKSIERCSATSVNPESTEVDTNGPRLLATHFGHLHCGIYGTVLESGVINVGDRIQVEAPGDDILDLVPAKRSPRFASILETVQVSTDVVEVTVRDPFGWFAEHDEPGTHLRVHFSDPVWRNYTITRTHGQQVTIAVRIKGTVSKKISQLTSGEELLVSGPYGTATANKILSGRTAFVTAGIGITPVLGLLRNPQASKKATQLRWLHVERGERSGLFSRGEQLVQQCATESSIVHFDSTVARPTSADIAQVIKYSDSVMICGPEEFTKTVQSICHTEGIDSQNVHTEAFVSPRQDFSDLFKNFSPARVSCAPSGTQWRWQPTDGVLLDALESRGIQAPSSCQAGSCGECALTLLKGDVSYPMEPSATIPEGKILTCMSVPTGDVELEI